MVTLAPAYDDPHMITCHMVPNPGPREYARQAMWEQWDLAASFESTDEGDIAPDDEELHSWARAAAAKTRKATDRRDTTLALLKGWWTTPERWSPWIDDIAVDRALQFDWAVIDNLTLNEHREFIERLMAEGWSAPDGGVQPKRFRDEGGRIVGVDSSGGDGAFANQRDANWRKGTKAQRDRIRKDIYDLKRGRRRGTAAERKGA